MCQIRQILFLLFFGSSFWITVFGDMPASVSSIDWQYKNIETKIRTYEKRLIGAIIMVQKHINSTMTMFEPDKSYADVVSTLKTSSETVGKLATVSCYSENVTSITCENSGSKIASISVDISRFVKIIGEVGTNNSKVIVESANIQGAYAICYYRTNINNTLRMALKNCSNSLDQLSSTYTEYSMVLTNSITQYNDLYVQLLNAQSSYCTNCVTNFSPSTSESLAKIDENVDQIQLALSDIETDIRNISSDIVSKVNLVNPAIKKTYSLYNIAVYLDSTAYLVSGFTQLDSMDILNETANCNDNNWKMAVIKYKKSLYYEMFIGTLINSTQVIVNKAVIEAYFVTDKNVMNRDQKTNVTAIITDLEILTDLYRQYNSALNVAILKFDAVIRELKTIQGSSCTCTGTTCKLIRYIILHFG